MFTLSLHFLFFLLSLTLLVFKEDGLFIVLIAIFFAGLEIFLWAKRESREGEINWLHPIPGFVLGYSIIYYQLPFCYFAGFELSYYSRLVLFSSQNISYCVLLAAMGLASFFCGEQLVFLKNKKTATPIYDQRVSNSMIENYFVRVKNINTLFLLLTLAFFFLYLRSIGLSSFFGFNYGNQALEIGAFSSHFGFAYTIFLYLTILLEMTHIVFVRPKLFRDYIRAWDIRVLAVIFITLVPFVLSGDRGSYLQPLALVFVPYFLIVKPLRFTQAILFFIIISFFLVLVGDTRGGRFTSWSDALSSRILSVSNPAEWPTMELANSFGTFNIATVYFPDKYPYNNGINTLYRLSSLVPLSSYFTEIEKKNKESDYIFSSSLFFSNILTQGTFSSGSGTSSLADIYLDFGPYGIPFVLFLWGLIMAWISQKAVMTTSTVFVFLYAYYAYFGIYVNRSSFFFGWNNFVWVLIVYYFINNLYLQRRLRL
jgi:oligosaccharide repeat unit polymerase